MSSPSTPMQSPDERRNRSRSSTWPAFRPLPAEPKPAPSPDRTPTPPSFPEPESYFPSAPAPAFPQPTWHDQARPPSFPVPEHHGHLAPSTFPRPGVARYTPTDESNRTSRTSSIYQTPTIPQASLPGSASDASIAPAHPSPQFDDNGWYTSPTTTSTYAPTAPLSLHHDRISPSNPNPTPTPEFDSDAFPPPVHSTPSFDADEQAPTSPYTSTAPLSIHRDRIPSSSRNYPTPATSIPPSREPSSQAAPAPPPQTIRTPSVRYAPAPARTPSPKRPADSPTTPTHPTNASSLPPPVSRTSLDAARRPAGAAPARFPGSATPAVSAPSKPAPAPSVASRTSTSTARPSDIPGSAAAPVSTASIAPSGTGTTRATMTTSEKPAAPSPSVAPPSTSRPVPPSQLAPALAAPAPKSNGAVPTDTEAGPSRPPLRPTTSSQIGTQYMNMLLALDAVPQIHNWAASFFTWILLAGFVIFPGTFSTISQINVATANTVEAVAVRAVQHISLFVIAFICSGLGAIGMCWLWWRWSQNYIWLLDRIFLPGALNGLAGVLTTIASVFGAQSGTFTTSSIITLAVTGTCTVIFGTLTAFYSLVMLGRVKRLHQQEVWKEGAGRHGEGVIREVKRSARTVVRERGVFS